VEVVDDIAEAHSIATVQRTVLKVIAKPQRIAGPIKEHSRRHYAAAMIAARHIVLFADYAQLYVQDADAHDRVMRAGAAMDPDRPPGGWTYDAVQVHRIALEPHSISVGTAREDLVETALAVHTSPPQLSANAEHIVEADLDVPTGIASVVGCTQPPNPENTLTVTPGRYRARVSYLASAPPTGSDPDVSGDHLRYQIDIWPATQLTALTVIRQGPSPWAG